MRILQFLSVRGRRLHICSLLITVGNFREKGQTHQTKPKNENETTITNKAVNLNGKKINCIFDF
jgi:hypothetical protein